MNYLVSYFGKDYKRNNHEISIYKNNKDGTYFIYYDKKFWNVINSLFELYNEINCIEGKYHVRIDFYGF